MCAYGWVWWVQLSGCVTHQRTVKVGQPPFLADEQKRFCYQRRGTVLFATVQFGVVCHASAHRESWLATIFGR